MLLQKSDLKSSPAGEGLGEGMVEAFGFLNVKELKMYLYNLQFTDVDSLFLCIITNLVFRKIIY